MAPVTVPFDPQQFTSVGTYLALALAIVAIPVLVWHAFRLVVSFRRSPTTFVTVFLVHAILSIIYETLLATSVFVYTDFYLTITRIWVLGIMSLITSTKIIYDMLSIFSTANMLPSSVPLITMIISFISYMVLYFPRNLSFILFVSPNEKGNWAAAWFKSTSGMHGIVNMIIYECICIFAVVVLATRIQSLRVGSTHSESGTSQSVPMSPMSSGSGSGRSAGSTAVGKDSSSALPMPASASKAPKRPVRLSKRLFGLSRRDAILLQLGTNLLVFMVNTVLVLMFVRMADAVSDFPPSEGWRAAQRFSVVAGTLNSFSVIFVWNVLDGLKYLLIERRRPQVSLSLHHNGNASQGPFSPMSPMSPSSMGTVHVASSHPSKSGFSH